MEGGKVVTDSVNGGSAIGGSGDGRPPIPFPLGGATTAHQHFLSSVSSPPTFLPRLNGDSSETGFIPLLRSGAWADIGSRSSMEDAFVCADNLIHDYGLSNANESPSAFYEFFDGHGGNHASDFACYHLPRFIVEDEDFPQDIERVIASAFLHMATAFAEACSSDKDLDSGTTALAAVVIRRSLVVANAGDCRAVLCRCGKAVEMSRDHQPICLIARKIIEASGGHISDGYLNGLLNVARALGDWYMGD